MTTPATDEQIAELEAAVAAWREFSGGSSLKVILRAAYAAERAVASEGT